MENELYHYGVLGMKWGIRKGRVSASTTRKFGDSFSERTKRKMTKQAVKVSESNRKYMQRQSDGFSRASEIQSRKGNVAKAADYANVGKNYLKMAKVYEKRVSDINKGTLKAGKDFITNREYSTNLLLDTVGIINVHRETTVDFKK